MRMPLFRPKDYFKPQSLNETVELLAKYGDKAKLLAGGTTLYELAKRGMIPEVEALIDMQSLNLEYTKTEDEGLKIGSTSILSDLLAQDVFQQPEYAAIGDALHEIRPPQIRNVATLGGELCASLAFFDMPATALAMDFSLLVLSPTGERVISIDKFWIDYFLTTLKKGEVVTEIRVPKPPKGTGSAFLKLGRTAEDFALVNVGARITVEGDGICKEARIGLGGVARVPIRATKVEAGLNGKKLSLSNIVEATKPLEELKPTASIHGGPEYKRAISKVLVRDAVKKAVERLGQTVS